jgi:O-antigen/teichoic acid export membrane protein
MLAHRVSADDLGLFAIASGGVNMMAMLIGAFRNAWQPFAFSIMGREDSGNVYGRTLTIFTFTAAMIAVCGSLFAPEALLIINAYTHKNWSGAAVAVGPLAMGTLFSAMYFVVQTGIYLARRTSIIAWTMASAAAVAVLSNVVLIPMYGILGAALATALGQLTALFALYHIAQRIAPIPYQPAKILATVLAAILVIILAFQLPADSVGKGLLYKIVLLLIYIALLLATRVITRRDLRMFWNGLRSALGSFRNHIRGYHKENHADSN